MELRAYWRIIQRRWWLVSGLLVAFLLSYILFHSQTPTTYVAGMRFTVGLKPEPATAAYYTYDRYYTWLTAEYLVDDLAEVVKSRAFAQDVALLAGIDVPAGAIQGSTAAGKLHRLLTVSISWHDPEELAIIADAVARTLIERSDRYFAQLSTESAVISLIDPPAVGMAGPSLRQRLDLPLRLILALIAGVALAFLLDYLDDTIRDRLDLEPLDLPILAEIPSRRAWWPRLRRRSLP